MRFYDDEDDDDEFEYEFGPMVVWLDNTPDHKVSSLKTRRITIKRK